MTCQTNKEVFKVNGKSVNHTTYPFLQHQKHRYEDNKLNTESQLQHTPFHI